MEDKFKYFIGNFKEIIKIDLSEWNDLEDQQKKDRIMLEEYKLEKKYAYNFNMSVRDLRCKINVCLVTI